MLHTVSTHRSVIQCLGLLVIVGSYALPAQAVDGQIELSQAQATAATGLYQTIVISRSGSYKLTSNLDAASGISGVQISVANVDLDLNGFSIIGRGTGGTADGIVSTFGNVRIHNGTVRDFTNDCLRLGNTSIVENLRAISCGNDGIRLLASGRVRFSSSSLHGATGITVGNQGAVEDSQAQGNATLQIMTGSSSRVFRCEVSSIASADGIVVGKGGVVSGNSVQVRNATGVIAVAAGDAATISGNSVVTSGGVSLGGEGISTGDRSSVEANTIEGFTIGLLTGDASVVRGNALSGPTSGDPNSFGMNSTGAGGLVVDDNSFWFFTVGVVSDSNSRFNGNTLRSSGITGSIGLLNSGTADPNAIAGNVLNNFSTNLQGSFIATGTNLYDGGTSP